MRDVLIKEEFQDLDEDMKHLFLKYLHKNLEESMINGWTGGGYCVNEKEDHFVSIDEMLILLPEGSVAPVKMVTNWIKGNLYDLRVSADLNKTEWNLLIKFLSKASFSSLAMVLAQKKEKHFFRARFGYMGVPLDGAYYIANFRISPASQGEGHHRENFIYLDMDIEGVDYQDASLKSQAFGKEITAILSVILNTGFYEPEYDERWVLLSDKEHGRFSLGFHDKESYPNSMPDKDPKKAGTFSEDPFDYLSYRQDRKTLCLPRSIRKLFKAYFSLSKDEKAAFLSASRMYQISLKAARISNTVRASYQLAALDALSKPYRKNTLNKNAIMNLIDRYYLPGEGQKIGVLYDSIRSAHFHQGYFDEDEMSGVEDRPFLGRSWMMRKESDYLFKTDAVFYVLNNWLSEKVPKEEPKNNGKQK